MKTLPSYATINTFPQYFEVIDKIAALKHDFLLFRGQNCDQPLLPSIARNNPHDDTTKVEKKMLEDFVRRSMLLIGSEAVKTVWDQLVYAQHFGLKTRLLDWTSNPLSALWFAISNEYRMNEDAYVYLFYGKETRIINPILDKSPFDLSSTKVLRPMLNNPRIIAQSGWFTIHKFANNEKAFVALGSNARYRDKIIKLTIPASQKREYLKKISRLGVNARFIFPDVGGLCQHLNWKYTEGIK